MPEDAPSKLPSALRTKYGPLEGWEWGLAAIVGFFVGRYVIAHMKSSSSSTSSTSSTPASTLDLSLPATGGAAASTAPSSPTTTDVTYPAVTNSDWLNRAISALIARGWNPISAQDAISNVLAGTPVPQSYASAYDSALQLVGPPPVPIPNVTIAPTPTQPTAAPAAATTSPVAPVQPVAPPTAGPAPTPPSSAPAGGGRYTVKAGDSPWAVLQHAYGHAPTIAQLNAFATANGLHWNSTHTMLTPFNPGQTVSIP